MIIEIKGLPDGHKIKHINVDVTFADGSCLVKTRAEPSHVMDVAHVSQAVQTVQDQHDDDVPSASIAAPNNDIGTRPKKEIPPEMVDTEF